MVKNYFLLLFLVVLSGGVFSQNGIIKGKLTEDQNGKQVAMPFANVFLEGTTIGATTGLEGNYSISAPEGSYVLTCSFLGYETFKKEVVVTAGGAITVNIQMQTEGIAIEGVKVEAKMNRESEIGLIMEQKKANIIKESIGAKQLSALGVSDAAAATSKISGVTKNEGSGDVYVRGLGDRYLSTTMNGLPVPSDDVEKKNIDLNLFSTDVIKNVSIKKTYSVDGYGDQTSGVIDVSSKTNSEGLSIGLSLGGNSNVFPVMSSFRATQNHNDLTMGFYSKSYELNDAVNKQSWNTLEKKMPLDYGYSILYGKKIVLLGRNLNFFATVSHSGKSEYRKGTYSKYRNNEPNEIFSDVEEFGNNINTTGLLNLEYELNDNNSIQINSLAIFKTKDELYEAGREGNGYYFEQTNSNEGDSSIFMRDQNIKTTRLLINQLLGKHQVGTRNSVNWGVGYNIVEADEPNRIRNIVTIPENKPKEFVWVGGTDQRKSSQVINDEEINGFLQDEISLIEEEGKELKLNVGASFRNKTRDFESNLTAVQAKRVEFNSIDNFDEVFLDEARYTNKDLKIDSKIPDIYNAKLFVYGGHLSTAWLLGNFSGSLGARYEVDVIDVDWDVANYINKETGLPRIGKVHNEYRNNILPSLNLKYSINNKNALRLAASKTLTLPEFKELAPFEYVSPEGRVTKGNEGLERSVNYNIDAKWEFFPTTKELLSVTGFYKLINDPINRAQKRGSAGVYYYANTGEKANVYGVELEGRYFIIKSKSTGVPDLKISANFTKMWFSQDLLKEFQYNYKTTSGLEGASEIICNGSLTYSTNTEKEFIASVVANYSSDKIYALGVPEDYVNSNTMYNSAIFEKGFVTLDVVMSKKLSKLFTVKLKAKNLLNPKVEQVQEVSPLSSDGARIESVKSYKKGIGVSLGLTINLN